ncbi:MAG: ABC transporter ATP-binding protein [Candidatus Omnitrophota bacterium]
MLKLVNVSKNINKKKIVEDVSFSVKQGETCVILGPSGSGKTTLLRMIAGFDKPDRGNIIIGGKDVKNIPPHKRNVGMVFQDLALWPHMSVEGNVSFCAGKDIPFKEITQMLQSVGLAGRAKCYPAQLSGGEQQKLALARSLIAQPKILLLDEPLSSIDPLFKEDLKKLILELQQRMNVSLIYVTHDQNEAFSLSDNLIVLHQGKIEQMGKKDKIFKNPSSEFVKRFLGL